MDNIQIEFSKSETKSNSVYICFHGYNSSWNEKDTQFLEKLNKFNNIFKIFYSNEVHKLNFIDVCDHILKELITLKINEYKFINILGHSFGCLFALKICSLFSDKINIKFSLILLDPVIIDEFYVDWLQTVDNSDDTNSHKIEKLNNLQNYMTLEQFMKHKGFSKIIVHIYLSIQNKYNKDRLKNFTSLCSTNIYSSVQIYNCGHMIHRERTAHLLHSLKHI